MTGLRKIFNALLMFQLNLSYSLCLQQQLPEEAGELIFTSIVYRHGERNPKRLYPRDPYRDLSFWPEGLAMLTNNGKSQHYQLGKWLRHRYTSLIPEGKYSHDLIYIQSTDWDRTLMSALSNLAGLFYPNQQEIWSDLQWQPIPVHTIPKELDKLLSMRHPCPKAHQEAIAVKQLPVVREYNKQHEETYKYLTRHTGENVNSPVKVEQTYFILLSETLHNYTLPSWTSTVFPDKMHSIGTFSFQMQTMTKTLKRLRGGPLLKDIITHMKEKRSRTLKPDRKLWVYSGHDTTVAALLDTMGVFEPHMPQFGATVLVDLRKNSNGRLQELYGGTNTAHYTCAPLCPLDTFESLLSDVIPKNWDEECQSLTYDEEPQFCEDS